MAASWTSHEGGVTAADGCVYFASDALRSHINSPITSWTAAFLPVDLCCMRTFLENRPSVSADSAEHHRFIPAHGTLSSRFPRSHVHNNASLSMFRFILVLFVRYTLEWSRTLRARGRAMANPNGWWARALRSWGASADARSRKVSCVGSGRVRVHS